MSAFFAERALLPSGWAKNVRLEVDAAGVLARVQADSHAEDAERKWPATRTTVSGPGAT